MKTENVVLLAAGAFLAYKLLNRAPAAAGFTEGVSGSGVSYTPVPTTSGVTTSMVEAAKQEGLNNAQVVNLLSSGSVAFKVPTSSGGTRTIVSAPRGTTKTSLNKNQYLAPRSGGGYKVVGARNIKLNP